MASWAAVTVAGLSEHAGLLATVRCRRQCPGGAIPTRVPVHTPSRRESSYWHWTHMIGLGVCAGALATVTD
jgi:hypothetical protein